MSGTIYMGGGFGGSIRGQMSDKLRRRLHEEEASEAIETARVERDRQQRGEQLQQQALRAAIENALDAGESFQPRWLRGEQIGHTRSEFLALASTRMDLEDRRIEMAERAAFNRWQAERTADTSADVSAPTPAELEDQATTAARAAEYRRKHHERSETIRHARTLARMDRQGY